MPWSKPVPCDLTRTKKRVSVPPSHAEKVPVLPGVCVIVRLDKADIEDRILCTGKTENLYARLSNGSHSPAERLASDIIAGRLPRKLNVVWMVTATKEEAVQLEKYLQQEFVKEFIRRPEYNDRGGKVAGIIDHSTSYSALKQHVIGLA